MIVIHFTWGNASKVPHRPQHAITNHAIACHGMGDLPETIIHSSAPKISKLVDVMEHSEIHQDSKEFQDFGK